MENLKTYTTFIVNQICIVLFQITLLSGYTLHASKETFLHLLIGFEARFSPFCHWYKLLAV